MNGDYPLAWAKTYGKGRVFYGSFAHASETWDMRDVQQMLFEAMRWALGLTDAEPKPHPMRGSAQAAAGRGRGGSRMKIQDLTELWALVRLPDNSRRNGQRHPHQQEG